MRTIAIIGLLAGAFVGVMLAWPGTAREPGPAGQGVGATAPDPPEQRLRFNRRDWSVGEYTLKSLARFEVEARVLSVARYRFGREADLSPLDFVVGWGPMSDPEVLDQLHLRHANRFYWVSSPEPPLPMRRLMNSSANLHLIPATDEVRRALRRVRRGDLVSLSGELVDVRAPDGWRWTSSLSRTDSGCELFWVERVGEVGADQP